MPLTSDEIAYLKQFNYKYNRHQVQDLSLDPRIYFKLINEGCLESSYGRDFSMFITDKGIDAVEFITVLESALQAILEDYGL